VGPGEREPANDPGSGGPEESSGPGAEEPTPEAGEATSREVVVEGDSIWTIAAANMPGEPTDQEVAEYVDLVAETNRDRLQSRDPDLIEPGETIILPPVAAGAEPAPEADRNRHDVAEGETFWTIARDRLAEASGGGAGEPTNQALTEYWAKVVAANQGRLASGDPDLIYPGETIILPPVD
jgi:nucleoid-associated protein YgaU